MRIRVLTAALVCSASLALVGCATAPDEGVVSTQTGSAAEAQFLADHALNDLDSAEIIEQLDTTALSERPSDLIASVRPDALLLSDDQGREVALPMPEDKVYLSIAPYESQTHDCYFHSLTTCVGELSNAEVKVTLTAEDGEVIVDDATRTYDNGFVGVWVPRGFSGTLEVTHDGRTGSTPISTVNTDDPTCITTLQLA